MKAPWTDEILTLIYSAGQDLRTFPLNQLLSLDTLLGWLTLDPSAGAAEITQRIFRVSVHPPLYFIVAHHWMALVNSGVEMMSLAIARLLPALLGSALVPAAFGLGWLAWRSVRAAHLAAALMAVSPYGIYLSQEARHYTLAMVWVMASLACLVVAVRALSQRRTCPIWVGLSWIIVNGLGIATHFFMLITLAAEALTLLGWGLVNNRHQSQAWLQAPWRRLYWVSLGTAVTGLVWLPVLPLIHSHQITQWIQTGDRGSLAALTHPIFQLAAAWITMLSLLPVESTQLPIVILSGLVMLLFLVWVVPFLWQGLKLQWRHPQGQLALQTLGGFVAGAIVLFLIVTYGLGTDVTRGARYNFVYFPAVMVVVGGGLAAYGPSQGSGIRGQGGGVSRWLPVKGWQGVVLVVVMGVASAITVVTNLGYQKYYRPDLLVPLMQAVSPGPVLVASTQTTVVQIGDVMAIGWEFQRAGEGTPSFLLAHQDQKWCDRDCEASQVLGQAVDQLPRPVDVWLVNFRAPAKLERQNCQLKPTPNVHVDGYTYQVYQCD